MANCQLKLLRKELDGKSSIKLIRIMFILIIQIEIICILRGLPTFSS